MNPSNKRLVGGALVIAGSSLLAIIAQHEGYKSKPYLDGLPKKPVWTVCSGITRAEINPKRIYTKAECALLLKSRVEIAGRGVLSCVKVPLNQNQYNAFTSLAYNIGTSAFCRSSIVTQANLMNYAEACKRLTRYNMAGGVVVKGLATRREAERKLCMTPVR
jgi:lysozyme